VFDIFSRVGGFLEPSVSKDDDLTYDFKFGCHFLKAISKSLKKLLKVALNTLNTFLDIKPYPSSLKCKTHLSGKNTDFRRHKPLYYLYTHCGAPLPPKICSGRHNY
jgi:hypothetical protein